MWLSVCPSAKHILLCFVFATFRKNSVSFLHDDVPGSSSRCNVFKAVILVLIRCTLKLPPQHGSARMSRL